MMVTIGSIRGSFWIVLLISSNILTGLFVSLNNYSSRANLCKMYPDIDNYDDTNPIYHNFDMEQRHRSRQPRLKKDNNVKDSLQLQQRNKMLEHIQQQLREQLTLLGILLQNSTEPYTAVHANCSIASKVNDCEFADIKTVFYLNNDLSTTCWSVWDTNLTVVDKCIERVSKPSQQDLVSYPSPSHEKSKSVFAITPTYARYTQKVDLTSLCQTVMNVPNMVWIVIEDSNVKTSLVSDLLDRCKVTSVHLNVRTPPSYRPRPGADRYKDTYSRGVKQRNLGLSWIKEYCMRVKNCTGAVYFMDDDNKYDLRLFEEIKKTMNVSVFPVGFSGGLKVEGPTCDEKGKATLWHAEWDSERPFPIDMAGFAIQIDLLLSKPDVWVGFDDSGQPTKRGYLETMFLENFASRNTVECRGNNNEVLVWHVKTQKPWILFEARNPTDDRYEI